MRFHSNADPKKLRRKVRKKLKNSNLKRCAKRSIVELHVLQMFELRWRWRESMYVWCIGSSSNSNSCAWRGRVNPKRCGGTAAGGGGRGA
jgi:hypothetical protein